MKKVSLTTVYKQVGSGRLHNTSSASSRILSIKSLSGIQSASGIHTDYRNILPTYHFQNALPRLPIPKVEDSLAKYLTSLRALEGHPHCKEGDILEAERLSESFLKNEADVLQQNVISRDKQNTHTSYITGPWFDMYLESRSSLPLNYNPFMLFKRDPNESLNHQTTRATNLIASALRFKKQLDATSLAPEVFYMNDKAKSLSVQLLTRVLPSTAMLRYVPMMKCGAYPLDMSQFGNLLSSTRIPDTGKDKLVTYEDSKHVIVLHQGEFYSLQVLQDNGEMVDAHEIRHCLDWIKQNNDGGVETSIAHLSTTDRDVWAETRQHLLSLGNEPQLEAIDSAIFCLVLESDTDTETSSGSVRNFLHGDARWYDKSFSLIVAGNGDTALNFEHAWGDGVAVVRFFNDVFKDSTTNHAITDSPNEVGSAQLDHVRQIQFQLDDKSRTAIDQAKREYDQVRNSLHACGGISDKLNKNFLKEKKVSPDGIVQLAIQMGYMYVFGHPAPTYESCSTSAFKHGRTETVRSCTVQSMAAARAMRDGKGKFADNQQLAAEARELIKQSCNKHNTLTKEAAMGEGFDRHLFALAHASRNFVNPDGKVPDLFESDTYKLMNSIILSTSTLNSDAIQFGGFAPVTSDGYGIGYGVRDIGVGVNVTSYDQQRAQQLSDAIVEAYGDIYELFKDV